MYGERLGKQRRRSAGRIQKRKKSLLGARLKEPRGTIARAGHSTAPIVPHPYRKRPQIRHPSEPPQIPRSRPGPPGQKNRRPHLGSPLRSLRADLSALCVQSLSEPFLPNKIPSQAPKIIHVI